MNKNIPTVLRDYNVYNQNKKLIGIGEEVTLPSIPFLTSTISGAGIMGEIDLPQLGRTGNIEQEIPFNMMDEEMLSVIGEGFVTTLSLKGANEKINPETGMLEWSGMSATFRGYVTEINPGTAKRADKMDSSIKMSLSYIKYIVNDKTLVEIDKLNGTFILDGKDMTGKYKQYT